MGGGGKGSKKVTVGYRYSWDVLAGLGRGLVNEIVSIMADKKTVFAGTPGQISSSTSTNPVCLAVMTPAVRVAYRVSLMS